MSGEQERAVRQLAEMQRDEAVRTLADVRAELTRALQDHRASELHLAAKIRQAEIELAQARDQVAHMERSVFWRLRSWLNGLIGR